VNERSVDRTAGPLRGTRPTYVVLAAVCLVAIGAVIGYVLRRPPPPMDAPTGHEMPAASPETSSPADIVVTLTPDMAARAGIKTVETAAGTTTTELRLPGIVQPHAYRQVAVTSLVSGRVTQVHVELGARVAAQQPLATIYSPELADAQTAFIAAQADQTAHEQRVTRTQRLTAIGAATREELEMHEAERARVNAAVEIARARLVLLGIPEERTQRLTGPQDVVTTIDVRAPFAGVVTQRSANIGLNIDLSTPLFTIVDLSTVWVIADLYERDFSRVRVGSPARITSAPYPDLALRGRVSYIDPQVQVETRTAKLRVEVPNPGAQLRLGMYVDVHAGEASERRGVLVPKAAVQIVGSDTVVYVQEERGRFVERKVQVGDTTGDHVLVLSGLAPGDAVATDGVFFLRAERERLQQVAR